MSWRNERRWKIFLKTCFHLRYEAVCHPWWCGVMCSSNKVQKVRWLYSNYGLVSVTSSSLRMYFNTWQIFWHALGLKMNHNRPKQSSKVNNFLVRRSDQSRWENCLEVIYRPRKLRQFQCLFLYPKYQLLFYCRALKTFEVKMHLKHLTTPISIDVRTRVW